MLLVSFLFIEVVSDQRLKYCGFSLIEDINPTSTMTVFSITQVRSLPTFIGTNYIVSYLIVDSMY